MSLRKMRVQARITSRIAHKLCMLFCAASALRIECFTDNLNHLTEAQVDEHLGALCEVALSHNPDIMVFGFQEARINKKKNDEYSFDYFRNMLIANLEGYYCGGANRVSAGKFKDYIVAKGIYLFIFTKSDPDPWTKYGKGLPFVSHFQDFSSKPFGCCGTTSNKGCVFMSLNVHYNMENYKIGFLNCHNSSNNFETNEKNFQECVDEVARYNCDIIFMVGDFNPRLLDPRSNKPKWIKRDEQHPRLIDEINSIVTKERLKGAHSDLFGNLTEGNTSKIPRSSDGEVVNKLKKIIAKRGDIHSYPTELDSFHLLINDKDSNLKWKEAVITFPATYLFQKGQREYDHSESRTFAHTDRIIWCIRNREISCKTVKYNGIFNNPKLMQSDHRVVVGVWDVALQKSILDLDGKIVPANPLPIVL